MFFVVIMSLLLLVSKYKFLNVPLTTSLGVPRTSLRLMYFFECLNVSLNVPRTSCKFLGVPSTSLRFDS